MEVMVVMIGLDRLWAVAWPVHYYTHRDHRNHRNLRDLAGSLTVSWIYSCLTVFRTLVHDQLDVTYNASTVCYVSIRQNYPFWRGTITMGFLGPAVGVFSLYTLIPGKLLARVTEKRRRSVRGCTTGGQNEPGGAE